MHMKLSLAWKAPTGSLFAAREATEVRRLSQALASPNTAPIAIGRILVLARAQARRMAEAGNASSSVAGLVAMRQFASQVAAHDGAAGTPLAGQVLMESRRSANALLEAGLLGPAEAAAYLQSMTDMPHDAILPRLQFAIEGLEIPAARIAAAIEADDSEKLEASWTEVSQYGQPNFADLSAAGVEDAMVQAQAMMADVINEVGADWDATNVNEAIKKAAADPKNAAVLQVFPFAFDDLAGAFHLTLLDTRQEGELKERLRSVIAGQAAEVENAARLYLLAIESWESVDAGTRGLLLEDPNEVHLEQTDQSSLKAAIAHFDRASSIPTCDWSVVRPSDEGTANLHLPIYLAGMYELVSLHLRFADDGAPRSISVEEEAAIVVAASALRHLLRDDVIGSHVVAGILARELAPFLTDDRIGEPAGRLQLLAPPQSLPGDGLLMRHPAAVAGSHLMVELPRHIAGGPEEHRAEMIANLKRLQPSQVLAMILMLTKLGEAEFEYGPGFAPRPAPSPEVLAKRWEEQCGRARRIGPWLSREEMEIAATAGEAFLLLLRDDPAVDLTEVAFPQIDDLVEEAADGLRLWRDAYEALEPDAGSE